MFGIRDRLQGEVHKLVGFGSGVVDLDNPRGDPGLFGPGSVTWKVHGDFTSMMIGGISALLLQMLHPGALAGVWDHSDFRRDMVGRLKGTAQFISGTTYASVGEATRLIERVQRIHDRVHGTLPDGTPYSANDPALLTWVHVAEVKAFLDAYLRYRDPALPVAEQDRYFREYALVAQRLGALDVPQSRAEVEAYLQSMRPALRYDERTRQVAHALLSQPAPNALLGPFREVAMDAGIDLLPVWAARMHGFEMSEIRRQAIRAGVSGVGTVTRWAMRDGSAARARRRVA
ncbi:oxygenase MpaB family protein [Aureimonas psammosilenae]|uniref:oxygenase MpaB family protein n=1 Tax=Aureimonas psammosilenae TaxID=2495496 RepID=UPI0012611C36|nr:oxygenase MpaB family protein [Aureimonas psammosilenae]